MIEKTIFYIVAFVMLLWMISKLLKRKDRVYIFSIIIQLIGIIVKICIPSDSNQYYIANGIAYILSIVFPVIIIILELKKIFISEKLVIFQAKRLLKYKKNSLARKKLVDFIFKYPNSYYAHKLLAKTYEKEGRDEDAIDEYVRAIEINSKDYDSYYQIAFLLNKNDKADQSEQMLKDLLSKKPDYYKASELLGTVYYDQNKFKDAEAVYLEALKYNPMRYELYYGLGMAYTRLNDFQTAKEYYEKAANLNSMLYHAKLNIAQIALITGDLTEAEEVFVECLESKDTEPSAYYYLAMVAMLEGNKDKAVSYVNIAIELDYRIYWKVSRQELFEPIMEFVRKVPEKGKKHRYNLSRQELNTKKHLDETFLLIEKMKNNGRLGTTDSGKIVDKNVNERYIE